MARKPPESGQASPAAGPSRPSLQWLPGTHGSVSYSHTFWAPLPAPMGLVRVSSLSFLELPNSLCSSFHGLQDDHKLSNKELETKYHTNIVTVSHEGTQIRRSSLVTVKKKGVWEVEGTIRMSDLWH